MSEKCEEKNDVELENNETTKKVEEVDSEETQPDENLMLIDKLTADLNTQKDLFLRTAAEYENYRKRTQREKAAVYNDAVAATVEKLLPVADSLELAIKSSSGADDDYSKGIALIKTQLDSAFEKLGVQAIAEAGEEFDPNLHNAVMHIEDETITDNTIVEVFQKGYTLADRVIRHAMVKVAN